MSSTWRHLPSKEVLPPTINYKPTIPVWIEIIWTKLELCRIGEFPDQFLQVCITSLAQKVNGIRINFWRKYKNVFPGIFSWCFSGISGLCMCSRLMRCAEQYWLENEMHFSHEKRGIFSCCPFGWKRLHRCVLQHACLLLEVLIMYRNSFHKVSLFTSD